MSDGDSSSPAQAQQVAVMGAADTPPLQATAGRRKRKAEAQPAAETPLVKRVMRVALRAVRPCLGSGAAPKQ